MKRLEFMVFVRFLYVSFRMCVCCECVVLVSVVAVAAVSVIVAFVFALIYDY